MKKDNNLMNSDLKVLIIGMAILSISIFLISLFWGFKLSFLLGMTIGYLYMCWNLFHLNYTILKAVNNNADKAKRYMYFNYILRYLVLLLIVYFAYICDFINVIGVIIPLFFPKIVFILNTIAKRKWG